MWNDILKVYANNEKETLNKKIAKYLIKLDKDIFSTNLTKVAKELKVSPSTITKFLNKAGYSGWKMYNAIALLNLNRKPTQIRDHLLGMKIEISAWIDLIFTLQIKSIAKKILKSSEIVLVAKGTTKSLLEMFKHNLMILGFRVDIRDMTDKYIQYPTKTSGVTILFSLSGDSMFIDNTNNDVKSSKLLGEKVFVSPSTRKIDGVGTNINLEGSNIDLNRLENILPMVKVHFVNHVLDKILNYIISEKKYDIDYKLLDSKLWSK